MSFQILRISPTAGSDSCLYVAIVAVTARTTGSNLLTMSDIRNQ